MKALCFPITVVWKRMSVASRECALNYTVPYSHSLLHCRESIAVSLYAWNYRTVGGNFIKLHIGGHTEIHQYIPILVKIVKHNGNFTYRPRWASVCISRVTHRIFNVASRRKIKRILYTILPLSPMVFDTIKYEWSYLICEDISTFPNLLRFSCLSVSPLISFGSYSLNSSGFYKQYTFACLLLSKGSERSWSNHYICCFK